ncbi:MAG: helix-turn-helix transcriptional regulator [Anaerolineae bacterium]
MPRRARWGGRRDGRACPRRIYRFVEPALLLLLHHGQAHGYELMDRLQDLGFEGPSEGLAAGVPVDSSVVYRTLRDMEQRGLVVSSWDTTATAGPPRRVYTLTALGDQVLASWAADLRETVRLIQGFLNRYEDHMEERGAHHHETLVSGG